MAGFIVAVYLLYYGMSAFLVCCVQRKSRVVYRGNRLFLFRQLASKVRTMRFTMGTLTLLLIGALLGGSFSLMLSKYQSQALDYSMPFDVLIYSPKSGDDFAEELNTIEAREEIRNQLVYQIYQNGSQEMNKYFCTHVSTVQGSYMDQAGNFVVGRNYGQEYYLYDTFMRLSDYNYLRRMLGEEPVTLGEKEYVLQTKVRISRELGEDIYSRTIEADGQELSLAQVCDDAFSQNGINGADYLIVVPDAYCEMMTPYCSVLAAELAGEGTAELQNELDAVYRHKHGILTYDECEQIWETEDTPDESIWHEDLLGAVGTDEIIVFVSDMIVRDVDGADMKFMITAVTFPLAYLALIFVCVALTILAVQQLSDSGKFRFRYDVLCKLGMKKREVNRLIFRQLALYYLVPAICAATISSVVVIYAGNQFVRYTGAMGNGAYYFGVSLLLFAGVYVLYFAATYVGFKRNIRQ